MFFCLILIPKGAYLHAGQVRRPSDVTPSILFTNPARLPLPPQFSHSRKDN